MLSLPAIPPRDHLTTSNHPIIGQARKLSEGAVRRPWHASATASVESIFTPGESARKHSHNGSVKRDLPASTAQGEGDDTSPIRSSTSSDGLSYTGASTLERDGGLCTEAER